LDRRFADRVGYTLESKSALPAGKATVKYELNYDGGGVAKAAPGSSLSTIKKMPTAESSGLDRDFPGG
jgi:hypothetical protein